MGHKDLTAATALLGDLTGQNFTYSGPTRLLRDAADWLIDGALPKQWREGYRPVFDALGIGGLPQGNRVFNIYDMNWLIAF